MKLKYLILLAFVFVFTSNNAQTVATDFTLTNCDGNTSNLYNIIDNGNVVVLIYEHQCSSCLQGATNVKNVIANNYADSTNLKVLYLDNGGYNCTSVQNWVLSHNLIPGELFAYSNDLNSPYGTGMPVIVVTSGVNHTVFLAANGYSDTATIHNAIKEAYLEVSSGINNINKNKFQISINSNIISIAGLDVNAINKIEIIDVSGKLIYSKEENKSTVFIELLLEKGLYFLRVNEKLSEKFIIK